MDNDFATLSVLIVEDDDFQRGVMARLLAKIGVGSVFSASTAGAALARAREISNPVDVVICDLEMPEVDGMEFLRLFAAVRPGNSVMISSAKDESILRSVVLMAKEHRLHVLGALQKPPTMEGIRQALLLHWQRILPRARRESEPVEREDIARGLEAGEFEPFFQPKVELSTGRICGAEALARWRHPERGIVPPGMFIALAEEHGLVDQLTWAMLEKSAAWIRQWGVLGLDLAVNVNLSATTLDDTRLSNRLVDIVTANGIGPDKFVLEITETVAMTNVARSLETLARLRMRGFGLSIDDFGTGYSSLQQLARVPYTELKIDQAFVTGAALKDELRAVLEASIDMARRLRLSSVAEGVETGEDWSCVKDAGCYAAQGYFMAKPMEGPLFFDWVRSWEFLNGPHNPLGSDIHDRSRRVKAIK